MSMLPEFKREEDLLSEIKQLLFYLNEIRLALGAPHAFGSELVNAVRRMAGREHPISNYVERNTVTKTRRQKLNSFISETLAGRQVFLKSQRTKGAVRPFFARIVHANVALIHVDTPLGREVFRVKDGTSPGGSMSDDDLVIEPSEALALKRDIWQLRVDFAQVELRELEEELKCQS